MKHLFDQVVHLFELRQVCLCVSLHDQVRANVFVCLVIYMHSERQFSWILFPTLHTGGQACSCMLLGGCINDQSILFCLPWGRGCRLWPHTSEHPSGCIMTSSQMATIECHPPIDSENTAITLLFGLWLGSIKLCQGKQSYICISHRSIVTLYFVHQIGHQNFIVGLKYSGKSLKQTDGLLGIGRGSRFSAALAGLDISWCPLIYGQEY